MFMVNYMAHLDLRSGRQPKIKSCQGVGSQPNRLDKCVQCSCLYHDHAFSENCLLQIIAKPLDFVCTLLTILQKARLYDRSCFWADMLQINGRCRVF